MADNEVHNLDQTAYINNGVWYAPTFLCSCGFGTCAGNRTWEEAGAEYDEHLGLH